MPGPLSPAHADGDADMTNHRIGVGGDGSSGSLAAADWALDEAFARDRDAEFVHRWESPALRDSRAAAAS